MKSMSLMLRDILEKVQNLKLNMQKQKVKRFLI